jgi:hypothetical protein
MAAENSAEQGLPEAMMVPGDLFGAFPVSEEASGPEPVTLDLPDLAAVVDRVSENVPVTTEHWLLGGVLLAVVLGLAWFRERRRRGPTLPAEKPHAS